MKIKWNPGPPPKSGIPRVSSERAKVFPKPIANTVRYSFGLGDTNLYFALGQLKSGRWEVYLWIMEIELSKNGSAPQIGWRWKAQSRVGMEGFRPGYKHYAHAYRSITQHIRNYERRK